MKKIISILVVTLLIAVLISFKVKSSSETIDPNERINTNLIDAQNFVVEAAKTNLSTAAKGTFLLEELSDNTYKMKINANIIVDSADLGGITFTIPDGWTITSIQSSYAKDEGNIAALKEKVSIWTAQGNSKWKYMIDIDHDRTQQFTTDGGEGFVAIELHSTKQFDSQSSLSDFIVEVGVDNKRKIQRANSINVSFSLKDE